MSATTRSTRITALVAGGLTCLAAIAGLATRDRPVHMMLWVVIAMVVGGTGLVVVTLVPPVHPLRRAVALLSTLVAAALVGIAAGVGFGLTLDADALFPWGHLPSHALPVSNGLVGATALIVAALALTLSASGRPARRFVGALATIPLVVGLSVCIGHLYVGPLLPFAGWHPITLLGGFGALTWGVGLIAVEGVEAWPLRLLAGRSVRATLLRWFLPFTVAVVVATDMATVHLFTRFSPAVGSVLNTLASVVGTAIVTTYLAGVIGTRLDRAEERALRLTRVYAVVSKVNELIAREHDATTLLRGTCEILLSSGGFSMAWVGRFDPATDLIAPVAGAGGFESFLDGLVISKAPGPVGGGPASSAIREGRPFVSREIASETRLTYWRNHSLSVGFAAAAAFPLATRGTPTHVISIYAADTR